MSQEISNSTAAVAATPKSPFFPDNDEYWFEALRAFGSASYGAADFGEVMSTINRIPAGDDETWYTEWNATAERVEKEANGQLARGHRVSTSGGQRARCGVGRRARRL